MSAEDQKIEQFRSAENFPVASALIPKHAREAIHALYQFARSADEIADDHTIPDATRREKLQQLYNGLLSGEINNIPYHSRDYYRHTVYGSYNLKHGLALLSAFIQDTEKKKYQTWEETLDYCRRSAATIGRHVLEATQEFAADVESSDKICTVLQLINHLQDLKKDYVNDGRLYFHQFNEAEINAEKESESVTKAKLEVIAKLQEMLSSSKDILSTISSIRVRAEIAVIYKIAQQLLKKLSKNDILTSRVELTKFEKVKALITGSVWALFTLPSREGRTKSIAFRSKSSFVKPLLKLDAERRRAMICFYSFCRLIDDAADDASDVNQARTQLNFWKGEVDKIYSPEIMDIPTHPVTRELELHVKKFGIERKYLDEMIAGQEMDISGQMIKPDMETFDTYCYRVAGCVGLVSVKIFGYNEKNHTKIENFAASLGRALQMVNILRDVKDDARKGRIYIPYDYLEEIGLQDLLPEEIYGNYDKYEIELEPAAKRLAEQADISFQRAMKNLPLRERGNMRPALMMKKIYQKYLEKMREYHFIFDRDEIALSVKEKFQIFYLNESARKI